MNPCSPVTGAPRPRPVRMPDHFWVERSKTLRTGSALPSSPKKPRLRNGPATAGSHQKMPMPRPPGVASTRRFTSSRNARWPAEFRGTGRTACDIRWGPAVGHFHEEDVFLVFVGHEGQVLAQVEQAAVPPGVVRLADHVVVDVVRIEPVKERLGAVPVCAAVDVDHDPRRGPSPRPASTPRMPAFSRSAKLSTARAACRRARACR